LTRIVINHLTRMTAPRICVAGVDVESKTHLRPVTGPSLPLTRDLLAEHGGPFDVGALVDLGETKPRPERPEVEDALFDPAGARQVARLSGEEYLHLVDAVACDSLEEAFGPDLQRRGWKYAVDRGEGECSLACVRAAPGTELEIDDRFDRKLQLRFRDAESLTFASVNDVRFYEADHKTIRGDLVDAVADRLRDGVRAWVCFGLARAYKAPSDDAERHWLQVNGLCLEDHPLGGFP